MAHISIIGAGNMGQALSGLFARGDNTVETFDSNDADRPVTGDVVVLAVPYPAVDTVLNQRPGQFDGRTVVDITNPVDFATFDSLTVPTDSSAAAEIAGKLPNARVVKAFNTTFAGTLAGAVGPLTTAVLIAGDDADAKATVAELVRSGGLKPIDAGSLKRAREMEALGFLQITLAAGEKVPWTGGFAVVD